MVSVCAELPLIEKLSNIRTLERIAGVRCYQYWITNFIFDFCIYMGFVAINIATICIYNTLFTSPFGGPDELRKYQ